MNDRTRVLEELLSKGFAVLTDGDAAKVAMALGRKGRPELLSPARQNSARPGTLSGDAGYGAFPWHTDGAIALRPPDWLVLRGVNFSTSTCTELAVPSATVVQLLSRTVLRARTPAGAARYLPAYLPRTMDGGPRIRWDESKCPPNRLDVSVRVRSLRPTKSIVWHEGQIVVIDNRRLLHRRPPVQDGRRTIERTYVWAEP